LFIHCSLDYRPSDAVSLQLRNPCDYRLFVSSPPVARLCLRANVWRVFADEMPRRRQTTVALLARGILLKNNSNFMIRGRRVPREITGEFVDSSTIDDPRELRQRLTDDGYVFMRGVLDKGDVLAAREEVFLRLADFDEIESPAIDGIATGRSRRRELAGDLIAFWRSVSEGPALREVSHGAQVRTIMQKIFGQPARPQDYLWLRPRGVGWSTGLHYDHPFFARGSRNVQTVWIPLGDIPRSDGPLMLVEGAHRFDDLIAAMHDKDELVNSCPDAAMRQAFNLAWNQDAIAFASGRNTRLLSTEFFAGDLLVFGMNTLHGSLDNHSAIGRVRLSCDVRYQPVSDPLDGRYFGPNPTGASGQGYGDMNSCKPLTEMCSPDAEPASQPTLSETHERV
jgi:hypothetical protein